MGIDHADDHDCLLTPTKEKVAWPANTEDVSHSIDSGYLHVEYELLT